MKLRNKKRGVTDSYRVIPLESVVADVENGRHKSIKRSLQEYGKENEKYVHVSTYLNWIVWRHGIEWIYGVQLML